MDAAAKGLKEGVAGEGEEGGDVGVGGGELWWKGEGLARGHCWVGCTKVWNCFVSICKVDIRKNWTGVQLQLLVEEILEYIFFCRVFRGKSRSGSFL